MKVAAGNKTCFCDRRVPASRLLGAGWVTPLFITACLLVIAALFVPISATGPIGHLAGTITTPQISGTTPVTAGPASLSGSGQTPATDWRLASDVLAHGNAHQDSGLFWIARVTSNGTGNYTRFFSVRASESSWQTRGDAIPSRAVSIASRGTQLAALLDDGSWILLSDDGSLSTGQRLPVPGAELVTLSDDGQTLWAVARVPGGFARLLPASASSLPSTSPSAIEWAASRPTASSRPSEVTSQPVAVTSIGPVATPAMGLALVALGPDGWAAKAAIPAEVARPGDEVSLATIDDEPFLASRAPDSRTVRLFRLANAHPSTSTAPSTRIADQWSLASQFELAPDLQGFKLLNGTPVPTIWARGVAGPDLLYPCRLDSAGSAVPPVPISLESTRGAPVNLRTAAYALGRIRCIYARDGDLYEQSCDRLTGAPTGAAAKLALPYLPTIPLTLWRYAVVTGAMLFAIGASFRSRDQLKPLKTDPDSLPLAPSGLRLLAGAIDALPAIAAWAFYCQQLGPRELFAAVTGSSDRTEPLVEIVLWAAFAIYLLHTTLSEVLAGRTLGKVIFGLRVVTLDGRPPTRGQMVTRNLLRIIDAGLIFLPLVLVPFSPYQQRAGDTAAGTIVILAKPRESEDKGKTEA